MAVRFCESSCHVNVEIETLHGSEQVEIDFRSVSYNRPIMSQFVEKVKIAITLETYKKVD